MEINNSYINNGATERGTRIVQKNGNLDKNSFFKILSAQLANQDPSNPADSTEFVAQLAQFTTLEEMENMNSTMTFDSAKDLNGKMVAFDVYNYKGEQYGGTVKAVRETAGKPIVIADVIEDGKIIQKEFNLSDVSDVFYKPDPFLSNINTNFDFFSISNMIGKDVKVADTDAVYQGEVKSTYKAADGVKAVVNVTGRVESGEMEKVDSFNKTNVYLSGVYKTDKAIEIKLRYEKDGEEGTYQYKIVEEGQDADQVQWQEYEADTEIQGIKMILPEEDPDLPTSWKASIKPFVSEEKHFYGVNVLEVGDSETTSLDSLKGAGVGTPEAGGANEL